MMQQWEYITQKNSRRHRVDQARLNELGQLGWELVSVFNNLTGTNYVFKRPGYPGLDQPRSLFDENIDRHGMCT
jgi:hypothetical protein